MARHFAQTSIIFLSLLKIFWNLKFKKSLISQFYIRLDINVVIAFSFLRLTCIIEHSFNDDLF